MVTGVQTCALPISDYGYCSVLGIIASVIGWRKKASAISIIGGADGPTSIFIAGKINYTPVYLLTALLILAAAATALVIRKQHRNKTDRPQK